MKALTLWQPWASLIAVGAKTIETRSWSTSYRGPLAIHAAATTDGFDMLPDNPYGDNDLGWRHVCIGDFNAGYCFRSTDCRRGDAYLLNTAIERCDVVPAPLGAFVAVVNLVDVLPIIDLEVATATREAIPGRAVVHMTDGVDGDTLTLFEIDPGAAFPSTCDDVSDQLPYGDFTHGRYAWLYDTVRPLSEPIPASGRQQLWQPAPADHERLEAA